MCKKSVTTIVCLTNASYTNFIETTNQGHKMTLAKQIDTAIANQDIPTLKHLMKQMSEKQAKANNTRLMNNAAKVFGWQR